MLLHSLLRMFHDLGMYVELFEVHFLNATRDYFAAEAATQLQTLDVPSYLGHVRTRLAQEEQRVLHYLHISTRKALLAVHLNLDAAALHFSRSDDDRKEYKKEVKKRVQRSVDG